MSDGKEITCTNDGGIFIYSPAKKKEICMICGASK